MRFNGPDGERRIPAGEIVVNEPLGATKTCVLRFPAGDCCEVANGRDLEALLEELGRGELSPSGRVRSRRRVGVAALAAVLLVVLLSPAGREWGFFIIMGGKWSTPKGWPTLSREWDKPTDPRELEAYEYAHALKLPESLPKPVPFSFARHLLSNRRTTAVAYFDHLCATEAGEYIFKTVDKVEGIYQMRAMPKREDKVMTDRYAFEDPADWSQGEAKGSPMIFMGGPNEGFRYFESIRSPEQIASKIYLKHWDIYRWSQANETAYWRYHHFDYTHNWSYTIGQVQSVERLEARYAYTWRGIRREHDRKHGIAGGELIVLDRITNEILGVRRSFAIARQNPKLLDWEFAYYCPKNTIWRRPTGKVLTLDKVKYPFDFISQVLNPIDFDPLYTRP
ncbi:hypothetical protein FACS1894116_12770 [Betaproteobacteria bacterium]|nr:hypothetical protein FACS1894116_12770 [Betaproteobacteria bacterium]GHU23474.1 hypothetical protein FACS189488_06110 [Betaproteobacteria bacterium]